MAGRLGKALGMQDATGKQVALWVTAGLGIPIVAGAVWYYVQDTYYYYTPVEYQYRPGMLSGWISKLLEARAKRRRQKRPIRVYMDGCFDMMHYGHANALRQAKALGDELVVGLIPDAEIMRNKGPPVMNEQERLVQVQAIKWVDEVMTGVPYDLTPEFLETLFTKHRIDYVVHGDDPCFLPDGTDAYAHAKSLGKFKVIKRTEGVSSTDIVGRMLMCTHNRLMHRDSGPAQRLTREFSGKGSKDTDETGGAVPVSRFMPTSRRIVQFSSGRSAPPDARIVYVDGAWDLFHVGHIKMLQDARKHGDFLLVGVHCDDDVSARRGPHLPIMNLHERALSVLACKYVDEVIIGAPLHITDDLLRTFNISVVVRGSITETGAAPADTPPPCWPISNCTTSYTDEAHRSSSIDAAAAGAAAASAAAEKPGGDQDGGTPPGPGRANSGGMSLGQGDAAVSASAGAALAPATSGGSTVCSTKEDPARYAVPRFHGMYRRVHSPSDMMSATIINRIVSNRQQFEAKHKRKAESEAAYYVDDKQFIAEL